MDFFGGAPASFDPMELWRNLNSGQATGMLGAPSPGISSADKAAMFGNAGYGEGMTGAETAAYDAKVAPDWMKLAQQGQGLLGQQQAPQAQPAQPINMASPGMAQPLQGLLAQQHGDDGMGAQRQRLAQQIAMIGRV